MNILDEDTTRLFTHVQIRTLFHYTPIHIHLNIVLRYHLLGDITGRRCLIDGHGFPCLFIFVQNFDEQLKSRIELKVVITFVQSKTLSSSILKKSKQIKT